MLQRVDFDETQRVLLRLQGKRMRLRRRLGSPYGQTECKRIWKDLMEIRAEIQILETILSTQEESCQLTGIAKS
jgi:hypothetical protein